MDTWNTPTVQSRQPSTYRLMESVGLGGPRWLGGSWQRGNAESGSSRLSTLMIETPGDLVWDLPCLQQASYLEGGTLMWILPLTCILIKNPMMMMMMMTNNLDPEKVAHHESPHLAHTVYQKDFKFLLWYTLKKTFFDIVQTKILSPGFRCFKG